MTSKFNQDTWAAAQAASKGKTGIKFKLEGVEYDDLEEFQIALQKSREEQIRRTPAKTKSSLAAAKKRGRGGNKYGAKRVQIDGTWFDSLLEGNRYQFLKRLSGAGVITDFIFEKKKLITLRPIEPFVDHFGNKHGGRKWTPDFQYTFKGLEIIEDVKGYEARDFKLVKMLLFRDFPELNIWINQKATATPTVEQFRRERE